MTDAERARLADALKRAFDAATSGFSLLSPSPAPTPVVAPPASPEVASAAAPSAGSLSFTTPLLWAVIAGSKTQTRRPIRPVPASVRDGVPRDADGAAIPPLCVAGDRLWVREKWARVADGVGGERFAYAADEPGLNVRWNASRLMPRAAARTFLDVTRVEARRLSAIGDADAAREGVEPAMGIGPRDAFLALWDSIYGAGEFAARHNPWVWVLTFTAPAAVTSSGGRAAAAPSARR